MAASRSDRQAAPGSGRPAAPEPGRPSAPAGRPYETRARSRALVLVVALVVLAVVFVLALGLGRSSISPDVVAGILAHDLFGAPAAFADAQHTIVMSVRLPRVVAAMLAGAALSVAGAAYQGLFRNPMVSPDILGASAGASFGAALALLLGLGTQLVQLSAFAMGFVAVAVTMALARGLSRGHASMLMLVLCGLVVGTLFQSFVSVVKYTADPDSKLPEITYWLMGSIAKVTWGDLAAMSVPVLVGAAPILLVRWRLNTLAFGEDAAASLGVNVRLLRGVLVFCATLLTACVVAMAGVVGWVGLVVPHVARFLGGADNRVSVPLSLVVGAAFLGGGHRLPLAHGKRDSAGHPHLDHRRAVLRGRAGAHAGGGRMSEVTQGAAKAEVRGVVPAAARGAVEATVHDAAEAVRAQEGHAPAPAGEPSGSQPVPVLSLDHVDCGYGRRRVLEDVTLAFPAGEACCILGPNGVGKTTLFRTLLGRLRPLAGQVLVAGRPASSVSARDFAREVAYVPQASEADTDLTVLDVALAGSAARVGALGAPGRAEYERAQAALAELGIERLAERPFSEVSGGERQMALIARALVQDARLVLMDEPTASLDFGNQARVLAFIRRLVAEGRGVVMTSHNPDHAFLCCLRAVLLRPGGRLEDGPVDEVVRADALAEAYGVGVRIGRVDMGDGTFVRACVPKV
ncbi:iron chelate uptake ABC transporter family permease subunit [uncultured Parolsenella sp.]|uniref:iron chelate uptake ABC transporter family permease subunit n=2 Tax=uncultured Parolsenella sp. TaxID=2083008 RepID=UPI0025DDF1FC|nr:iron chelate uptake ABC transporter family permease subunit [uncultured Parolsenella sp.]